MAELHTFELSLRVKVPRSLDKSTLFSLTGAPLCSLSAAIYISKGDAFMDDMKGN